MGEKHNVSIDDSLYQDIKEYCQLNNLKINIFVGEMLHKQFMIEKYGDAPFANFRKKIEENTVEIEPEIQRVIADNFFEMLDGENEIESEEIPDTSACLPKEQVNEIEMDKPDGKLVYVEPKIIEQQKENVVKNIEKPIKRRLK